MLAKLLEFSKDNIAFAEAFIVVLLFASGSVFAQSTANAPKPVPDFTGTWKFSKTGLDPSIDPKVARQLADLTKSKGNVDTSVVISHDGSKFVEKRSSTANGEVYQVQRVYYTDGRGETNPFEGGAFTLTTTTKLNKRTLIIEGKLQKVGSNELEQDYRAEWTLSKDDKKLTITSSITVATNGNLSARMPRQIDIYIRQ